MDGGVEASSQEKEMPSQEKPVVEVEKEAEKEMPSQEKKVMEVEKEPVKEMEKTARDEEKEKELKKEKNRMRKEFEAINEMKATHGGDGSVKA